MDKEKIIVGLLILTIVLSIGSILITSNLNSEDVPTVTVIKETDVNSGDINLVVGETPKNEVTG